MQFKSVLQEYEKRGNILKHNLGEKSQCKLYEMESTEGKPFVLRVYDHPVEAYATLEARSCPHIPKVIKTDLIDDIFVVEEEFIDGISLWKMISGGTRMEEKRATEIMNRHITMRLQFQWIMQINL